MYKKLIVDPLIQVKSADVILQPIVVTVHEFNDKAVSEFTEQMEKAHQTGQPIIPVVIESYGGSAYGCLSMIEILQKASLPVYTITSGRAMSAGAMLFAMGERRYMAEKATLMLHDVASFSYGKVEELKSSTNESDRLNNLVFKLIAKNCEQKEDYFLKLIHEKSHADWFLTPKEAKKHKLCTHIGMPQLKVEVKVNYDFS